MILLALLLQAALPADWSTLPTLRWRTTASAPAPAFVRDEIAGGRCPVAAESGGTLQIDLAVLVASDGAARQIVPRAIGCPTVEQYAVGLVEGAARRDGIVPPPADQWQRTTLAFALTG